MKKGVGIIVVLYHYFMMVACVVSGFSVSRVLAADLPEKARNAMYSGAVLHGTDWLVYSTAVRSLWGGIHEQGWQVRVMSGRGRYRYEGEGSAEGISYQADKTVVEAMAGYQLVSRPFFMKLYAGPHMEIHTVAPADPVKPDQGRKIGAKVQFEGWMDLDRNNNFVSLDASFSTLESSYLVNAKVGMQPFGKTQIGLEAEFSRDIYADKKSVGVFATYRITDKSVLSVTVGGSQDNNQKERGFYSRLKYDVKF